MNRASGTSYRGTTYSERMAIAPCLTTDPELGFPANDGTRKRGNSKDAREEQAKKVCQGCPLSIKRECLEVAMRTEGNASEGGRYGVFGGLDPQARAALAKERRAELRERVTSGHGTAARAQKHRRAGEDPCGPCLAAETEAARNRAQKKAAA